MSSIRITSLPELESIPDPNLVFIPVVVGGVTRRMSIAQILKYRTAGTVKGITSSSSVRVAVNTSSGRATASFYLPGAIALFPGTQVPDGWLLCYGQNVSRSTYVALFSAIGVTYGVGDGRSTFNLPDLRSRVAVGHNTMGASDSGRLLGQRPGGVPGNFLGAVGGEETHTLLTDETPVSNHTHSVLHEWDYASSNCENGNRCNCGGGSVNSIVGSTANVSAPMSYSLTGSNLNNQNLSNVTPHKTVPPLVFLNYIIKY